MEFRYKFAASGNKLLNKNGHVQRIRVEGLLDTAMLIDDNDYINVSVGPYSTLTSSNLEQQKFTMSLYSLVDGAPTARWLSEFPKVFDVNFEITYNDYLAVSMVGNTDTHLVVVLDIVPISAKEALFMGGQRYD